jgi:hypothetical protein
VDQITVVIPTSPIPSHPSTTIIQETIASVRWHLPDSPILIQVDGLRPEQEQLRESYDSYRQILQHIANAQANIRLENFGTFQHQAAMMKKTIGLIETPLMIYVEHDTPLCENAFIDWDGMCREVLSGNVNSLRLHHYDLGHIHPEHEYLMLPKRRGFVPYIPTVQWSQRAHLTTPDFYRRVLSYFGSESRTMIEDHIYEVIMRQVLASGKQAAWESWRLAIYAPEGHIKRSRDLNGRAGGPKFEETFHAS